MPNSYVLPPVLPKKGLPDLSQIPDFPVAPIRTLIAGNQKWSQAFHADPANAGKIEAAAQGQKPEFLWIGCCDSRVPPTTICDKTIGEIFVHRNIANIVRDPNDKYHNDPSLWSAIEYALGHFPLSTIVICGHTDCGGAKACLNDIENDEHLSEDLKNYLAPLVKIRREHQSEFKSTVGVTDPKELAAIERYNAALLAKLNVQNGVNILRQLVSSKSKRVDVKGLIFDVATLELDYVPEYVQLEEQTHLEPAQTTASL